MLFTDNERRVYGPYDNGQAVVFGDPFKINRTLIHLLQGEPNQVIADYNSKENSPLKFEATNKLVAAGIGAFGLTPLDEKTGKGSTETDVIKVVIDFMNWCSKKNEKPAPTPTLSPASDGPRSPFGGPMFMPPTASVDENFRTVLTSKEAIQPTPQPEAPTAPTPLMPRVGLPSG